MAEEVEIVEQDAPLVEKQEPAKTEENPKSNEKLFSRDDMAKMVHAQMEQWKKEQDMTAEELASQKEQERLSQLQEREEAIRIRETTMDVQSDLQEAGLPKTFAGIIAKSSDEDERKAIVTDLKTAFLQAVQAGIKEGLQGKKNPTAASTVHSGSLTADDIMKEPDDMKRQQLIKENMALFTK